MAKHAPYGHLSVGRMALLPVGARVVNGNSDIATKREDGKWQGRHIPACSDKALHSEGPIRLWTGLGD